MINHFNYSGFTALVIPQWALKALVAETAKKYGVTNVRAEFIVGQNLNCERVRKALFEEIDELTAIQQRCETQAAEEAN